MDLSPCDVRPELRAPTPAAQENLQVVIGDSEHLELAATHGGVARDPLYGNLAPSCACEQWIETGVVWRVAGDE